MPGGGQLRDDEQRVATPAATHRVAALDGIRALAILAVMAFHFQSDVFRSGALGVDMFFVLSGFLITGLLLGEHTRRGGVRLGLFYARRALRLWPALTVLVVATVVRGLVTGKHVLWSQAAEALTWTTNLFGAFDSTPNALGLTWSLGVEEQFYLLWPPLLLWGLRRGRFLQTAVTALAVSLVAKVATVGLLTHVSNELLPTSRFDEILAGAVLAAVIRTGRGHRAVVSLCRPMVAWPCLVLLGAAVIAPLPGSVPLSLLRSWLVTGLVLAVIGHSATWPEASLPRLLSSRPATWLGQRSYSVYLWHLLVLALVVDQVALRPALSLPILTVLSLIVGHASYVLIERPFLVLKPYPKGDRPGMDLDAPSSGAPLSA